MWPIRQSETRRRNSRDTKVQSDSRSIQVEEHDSFSRINDTTMEKKRFPKKRNRLYFCSQKQGSLPRLPLCRRLRAVSRVQASCALVVIIFLFRPIMGILFGKNSIHGGLLGMLVDYQLRRYVMKKTLRKRQAKLDDMGVHLPDPPNMGRKKFPLLPNVAIGGMVIQSLEQATLLREMEVSADVYEKTCLKLDLPSNGNSGDDMTKRPNDQRQKSSFSHLQSIPKVILQPTYIEWNQKQKRNLDNFHIISIEEAEMQKTVHMQCPELQGLYNAKESRQNRIDVWSICSLYRYGGVYLSESNQRIDSDIAFIFKTFVDDERDLDSINTLKNKVTTRECASPVGYLIVDQYTKNMSESILAQSTPRIGMLAVSPRHPSLLCAMKKLSVPRANLNIAELLLESLGQAMLDNAASDSGSWMLSRRQKGGCDNMTTLPVTVSSMKMSSKDFDKINGPGSIFTKVRNANSLPLNGIIFQEGAAKYDVSVTERSGTSKPAQTPKLSLGDQLVALGSVPSWLCNRCLKTVSFGSFDKCRLVCSMRYQDVMCSMAQSPPKKKTVVDVTIRGDNSGEGDKRFIPRIIHQTWFKEPTALRYPQLVRLQNSWRASGWEYRFYTDDIAREYVLSNYPSRFLDAFDALIPGAFKADFFRYLVLLKDGGVYADVDIMLGTNLDTFVPPSMDFFVPLDLVGEYAGENFCLWNGLIGSAPGHPYMVTAVERLLNLILDRADVFDLQRQACIQNGRNVEIWKILVSPVLHLSGPCALGASVNDAIGRNSFSRFDVGWMKKSIESIAEAYSPSKPGTGDTMILVADKSDLGAFRHSDPERNIIVATTDLRGLSKAPLEPSASGQLQKKEGMVRQTEKVHYSETNSDSWVWGTRGVYKDNMVNNEEIRLNVSYL